MILTGTSADKALDIVIQLQKLETVKYPKIQPFRQRLETRHSQLTEELASLTGSLAAARTFYIDLTA